MPVRAIDDKSSDTLVVVSGEGFWTGSSTLPHLHQQPARCAGARDARRRGVVADYAFLTTWCLDAPIEAVFDVLQDSKGYPAWWKGVTSCDVLEPADETGVGELDRFIWRSVLPYTLTSTSARPGSTAHI